MDGFITYWPKEQIRQLEKENDKGPISVIFGSIHTKMPSIKSVKAGDIIYPVTIANGNFYAVARLPVEKVESAYDYLVREIGNRCGALVPDGVDRDAYRHTPKKEHKCHQEPFKCCSETAAISSNGSLIEFREIPKDKIPELRFGPTKSKQKPLRLDKDGNVAVISVSGSSRKMSEETLAIFEALF